MSTCSSGNADCRGVTDGNELARRTVIKITVACAALFLFLVVCGLCLRRRRIQGASIGLNRIVIRPPNPSKQSRVPIPINYPGHYQSPPPPHIPRYPLRGNNTYLGDPQWQGSSSIRRVPESPALVSPASPRAPSSVTSWPTSRPVSSVRTAPLSVRENEPAVTAPSSPAPTLSTSFRSPRRHAAGVLLPPTSPPPRNTPSVANSVTSTSNPPSNPSRPPALSPIHTGMSTGILDEPPPAYTPI